MAEGGHDSDAATIVRQDKTDNQTGEQDQDISRMNTNRRKFLKTAVAGAVTSGPTHLSQAVIASTGFAVSVWTALSGDAAAADAASGFLSGRESRRGGAIRFRDHRG